MKDIQRFRGLNFSSYFGLGALMSMSIPLLLHKGFTPQQIGIITACYTLAGFFSNYIIGYLCDRFGTIKRIYVSSYILATVLVLGISLIDHKPLFLVFYISAGFFLNAVMNLNDSWVMEHSEETRLKYGTIRSFGSIGWAACTLFIGYLIDVTDYWIIGVLYVGMAILSFSFIHHLKDSPKQPSNLRPTDMWQLFKRPNYAFFLLCLLLFGITHGAFGYIPPYLIKELGAGNSEIGFYNFVCAGSEILILAFAVTFIRKLGEEKMFLLASVFSLLRLVVFLYATNLALVYLAGMMHMFTFGLFLMSTKSIIDKLTPSHLKTTGQMLWAAVFIGLGMVISSTINGYLIEHVGLHYTLYFFLFTGIVATLCIFIYYKKQYTAINKSSIPA